MTAIPPQPAQASREAEDDPNAFLFDDAVERASLWERYKVALWLAVLQLWRPWRRKIGERTRSGVERIASRGVRATETKAFEALLGRQADAVDKAFSEIRALMKQELREAAIIEAQATTAGMQAVLPQVQLGELTEGAANRVVAQRPFEGRVLKKHFDRLSQDTKDALERAVRQGLVNGESAAQIAARVTADLGGTLTMSTRNLEVTVKTAVTAATNAARFEALREMRQHIQKLIWVATLDSSTCVICAPLDGTTINLDDPGAAIPPQHYACRCSTAPIIAGAPAGERASVNGPVPGDMTYDDWLRLQPVAVQNRVLGKGRAQMWRDGKLGGLNPLVLLDANRRPVPLKVLRERLARRRRNT